MVVIKCRSCKTNFEPIYRNGIIVSRLCLSCIATKAKSKVQKDKAKEKAKAKERLKTHSQWLNDLQKVFNKYIRLRDKGMPCISCGCSLVGKYDAGHFFSLGAYPNLRFNEDNVHGQCVACNQHRHGNTTEYSLSLPMRIGIERYEQLLEIRNKPLKMTTEEIKEQIEYYKIKIKEYELV
ncbi:recombination protein NinG [Dysgonomonas sp. 521]|uniref:recombination protein NinG n=1 Tax=Dysgonomonas sp. 521 TaxID=2302932 RepID=UPI0013D2A931|nr:recombination protein NinG [Dysgonomonas sp. 521]NDV93501.1 recombination protein NinG [Dysgonomonas sp. 521]